MADLTDEINNAEYDGVIYNNKYTNIITRQSIINKSLMSDEEAADLLYRLFHEYERVVLHSFVMIEKIKRLECKSLEYKPYYTYKQNKQLDKSTCSFIEMLPWYNESLKHVYKIRGNFSESEVNFFRNLYHGSYVHMRFVMFEKSGWQGTMPSDFDRYGNKKESFKVRKDRYFKYVEELGCVKKNFIEIEKIKVDIENESEGIMWLKICEYLF